MYMELKSCSYDILQLKFSSVLTKSTPLILTQCSDVKNVHICIEKQLYFDETESEFDSARSEILQKLRRENVDHLPVSYMARISLNEFKH